MIGIIVTGHGRFAEGIESAVRLISGPQENFCVVNFEHEVDELTEDLTKAMQSMKDCEGIIVFTDLAGGSPFKVSVMVSQDMPNVEVIAGSNLPMIIEISMARGFGMDLNTLVDMALNSGKDQIMKFALEPVETYDDSFDEDGI